MTASALVQNFQIHCHHCKQWLGESSQVMRLIGLFEAPRDRARVEGARDSWHCKKCGWVNVFRPAAVLRSATSALPPVQVCSSR
jgi:hypothetical protein